MGKVKKLLNELLLNIYGKSKQKKIRKSSRKRNLQRLNLKELFEIEATFQKHIIMIGLTLEEELIIRDRYTRSQKLLCKYVDAALHFFADNTHPPMRFSLTPPPAKSPHIVTSPTNKNNNNSGSDATKRYSTAKKSTSKTVRINLNNNMQAKSMSSDQRANVITTNSTADASIGGNDKAAVTSTDVHDDYIQWLHAMKLVARLPGGMPPEFRRKLWLTLAEKYLKSRNVDWEKEEKKCLSEEWREDDEELGVQIVKDLHRTGSNLCSGPAAKVNQAILKRVLLGYARYNPEVGYCQGFNMLGALILQVMDKEEVESMKVMIYLVEGILPPGYFCGSMGGLQADMGVFRDLMQCKLPRLAKHLEKLQGPVENAFEPPLTNVFTMQWFLTMFCTCLPMTCVLRVWDLVLIEGSDVLLRTALVLWSLLEERVLGTRSADDFYCKMGSFASELLNGHLIDSNSLIEKVVQLGPISDIEKLRNKHLYNITPTKHKSNIPLYLGDDESENDEDSRLAIATVWGIPWSRRGSQMTSNSKQVPTVENKDRIALDISLLKKQYDKLRERQKQAHIIITTACSTARQGTTSVSPSIMPVNQLLMGRTAIITNQGRRIAPPTGAIPPARKPSLPTILQSKPVEKKQLRRGETLHWRDTDLSKRRRDSLTWKEIKADRASLTQDELTAELKSQKLNSRFGKSDSSSYSEESEEEDNGSSTDTSLCDDDPASTGDKTHSSSIENSPKRRLKSARRNKASENKFLSSNQLSAETYKERTRPKSWAPSTSEIPFVLLTSESPTKAAVENVRSTCDDDINEENKISRDRDRHALKKVSNTEWVIPNFGYSPIAGDLATTTLEPLNIQTDIIELPIITSTSQLSPMPDITSFLKDTTISPLPTPKPSLLDSTNSLGSCDGDGAKKFDVSDDGVTNQYFERVNSVERPTKLDLYYSLNDDDNIGGNFEMEAEDSKTQYTKVEPKNVFKDNQRPDLLIDHPQHLEADNANININDLRIASEREEANQLLLKLIGERDDNIPGENLDDFREQTYTETHSPKIEPTEPQLKSTNSSDMSRASQKRRDPRRLTLTRSTTMDIEERFQALEKHFDKEKSTQSFENPQNDELSSKHDVNRHEAKENIHCSELNRLSSTENLNKENIHAPLKDNITTISSKPEIPSTTDLEERYERQMSVSDKTEKDLVDLPRNSRTNDDINDKKNARKESIEREIKDNEVKKDSKIATEKENESTESDNSKKSRPSPKRMPSTAELEERFDALEIKTKAEKISPTKNKKEPPDIKTETKKTPSEVEDVDRVSQEVNKKEDRKITQESSKMEAQKEEGVKVEATKKKTPPSTAELEKRFHALEKQMSTSTLTHDTREKVESTHSKTTIKSRQSSEEKENSDTFREALKEENTTSKAPLDKNETDTEKDSTERNESTKGKLSGRRASEPPSTEDLERRYESLKRRMSTRIFTENTAGKSETIDEALQRIEKKVMGESDYKDERTQNTAVSSTASHSTEFKEEKEHIETQKLEGEPIKKKSTSDNLTKETSPIKSNNQKELPSKTKPEENDSINMEPAERSVEQHIPDAPPLPAKSPIEKTLPNVVVSKEHQSLIEELQSKIDLNSDEETLKPSSINPNRKPPLTQQKQLSLKNDETSETHALNAFLQSENFEPWHGYTPKMVRRFSDLPSRADLENRLEFLEQKFYKKLYKQRCASDSEVASRKHFIDKRPNYEAPSTSASTQLEQRLQALEKQLSENSLKLLEAMRAKTQDIVIESESPRRLSTDTIDATGKELVRYTHVGELEESGILKPINISINIKMTLDKNAETKPNEKEIISSNDLERRLEALEEQLKVSQKAKIDAENDLKICKQELKTAELLDEKQSDKPKIDSDVQKVDQTAKTTGSANNDESAETGKMVLKKPKSIEQQENLMDKNNSKSEINQKEEITACKEETAESEKNNFKNQNEVEKVENQTKTRQSQKEGACPKEVPSHKEGPSHKEELKANQKETESKKSVINEKTSTDQKENPTKEKCSKCESNRKELLTSKKEITESQKTDSSKEKIAEKTENKDEKIKASQKKVSGLAGDTKLIEKPLKKPEILKTLDDEQSCPKPEAEKTLEKKNTSQKSKDESTSADRPKDNQVPQSSESELLAEELANSASGIGSADPNKKTLVLLLNNEPKAVKVRRLTRANTEELEGLFQALEKQLHERNLVKSDDGKLMHMDDKNETKSATVEAKAISELTKEIEEFTHAEKSQVKKSIVKEEQPYDWGTDPIKRHLKRKTAHLPSTKELEARFRSLERQIKLLEDVENIDVEQRLHEIERKIKLQYSLAHETDLTKYLELCEGKGLDDEPLGLPSTKTEEVRCECGRRTPSKGTPKTSPGCTTIHKSSHSPTRKATTTPGTPPASAFNKETDKGLKDRSTYKAKNTDQKKQPIHPLEMLLDPSPDDSKIPTTGELEHRIRMLDEKRRSPTPTGKSRSKSRSKSPARDSVSKRTPSEERYTKQPLYAYSKYDDMRPSPPTAEELEARMRALEEDHVFDPKTQRNFKEFNEKLKNVISPSVSFEEYRIEQTREVSPRRSTDPYRSPTSKSALRSSDNDFIQPRSTSPKVLRFSEDEDRHSSSRPYKEFVEQRRPVGTSYGVLNTIEENSKILHRILKKTIAEPKDGRTDTYGATMASFTSEGLDAMGSRLMRETSPLRRTGTHTGVPLKTDDNINERLSSIKDTIKSIDSLCEEKPYRKEKCQRYIDSLFSDSVHFAQKKTSLEDLRSRSASRTRISDYTPSIHVSDLSQRPSEYYLSRSIGSAESIRTTSPLRAASPLHYRSNRDLSRNTDVSPGRRGRRYDEEREEYESRVRRDYMLPNLFLDNHSNIRGSGSSLTKFYKVDSQLEPYERDISRSHTPSRSPVRSSYELRDTMTLHNNSYTAPNTQGKSFDFDKPISPYRQTTHNMLASDYAKRLNTPVYSPSKLEIRHTTVTSTFYDRLLTEKQLEKSSRPPSRSPVHAGPSIADKSYMDTTTKAGNNSNDSLKVSNNFSSSLNSTLTAQTTTLHHNTNTTTTAAFTGSIGLTTSTVTTGTTLSMTPFSINSTQSYLNNTNQTTSAATSTTTYTISENNPIGSNNSRSYINLLSSSNLSTSPAVITTSYSSFLPSITDKITSALTSSTASSAITVPFIANSSVPTLSSYPSTSTTVASYPLMSATFQPSIYGSNTLGLFSSTLGKSDSNITSEFKN